MMLAFVTAQTFYTTRDCLLAQSYFCVVYHYTGEARTYLRTIKTQKKKIGVTIHFSDTIHWKKCHALLFVYFKAFLNYSCLIISENAWLPPIFFFNFNSPCYYLRTALPALSFTAKS